MFTKGLVLSRAEFRSLATDLFEVLKTYIEDLETEEDVEKHLEVEFETLLQEENVDMIVVIEQDGKAIELYDSPEFVRYFKSIYGKNLLDMIREG